MYNIYKGLVISGPNKRFIYLNSNHLDYMLCELCNSKDGNQYIAYLMKGDLVHKVVCDKCFSKMYAEKRCIISYK